MDGGVGQSFNREGVARCDPLIAGCRDAQQNYSLHELWQHDHNRLTCGCDRAQVKLAQAHTANSASELVRLPN